MKFNDFFPTVIANEKFEDHDKNEDELVEHCLNLKSKIVSGGQGWVSNKTYNTSDGRYDVFKDEKFKLLNEWGCEKVKIYCLYLNIDDSKLKNTGSWFNVYQKYDFQENHVHPNSIISTIYILKASENAAKIHFVTPLNNMFHVEYTRQEQKNVQKITCQSIPGTLIIFPSYLPHSVERHDSDNLRISLSYNFKQNN